MSIDVSVTLKGGLFGKNIPSIVEKQLVSEVLTKVEERTRRQGRGLGAKRNTVGHDRNGLVLNIDTTFNHPRRTGASWQRKNIGIIKAMAPRVMRKAAARIAEEMG